MFTYYEDYYTWQDLHLFNLMIGDLKDEVMRRWNLLANFGQ